MRGPTRERAGRAIYGPLLLATTTLRNGSGVRGIGANPRICSGVWRDDSTSAGATSKRCLDRKIGTFCHDMRQESTTEAVRDENAARRGLDSGGEALSPCSAIWPFPIGLMNALCAGKQLFKASLPVMWSRAIEARDDEDRRHHSVL
jgi:hypothetical protein